MKPYGMECILDIHECEMAPWPWNRENLGFFCQDLCRAIGMTPEQIEFWDYEGDEAGYDNAPAHLKGTTCVQFIRTSNITIHALDELKRMYVNVFSCKPFKPETVRRFCMRRTGGVVVNLSVLTRI